MSYFKPKVRPVSTQKALQGLMTEEQLGENIRDACKQLCWHFLWLRKTQHSSDGILDLMLVSTRGTMERDLNGNRAILHRELKGHDRNGRLGRPTEAQNDTMSLINAAGGNAGLWVPADWYSGKILEELR